MKLNRSRIVYDDPWEDEIAGCRFWASICKEDGELSDVMTQADNIIEGNWNNILKLREYFDKQLEDKYKRRSGKKEILKTFQEKRLFEGILTLFLGGYEGMKRSQDCFIRHLEQKYSYIIREMHATLTTAPSEKADVVLSYEDITHDSR